MTRDSPSSGMFSMTEYNKAGVPSVFLILMLVSPSASYRMTTDVSGCMPVAKTTGAANTVNEPINIPSKFFLSRFAMPTPL
ncbi:hypothetical protein D3C76_1576710 [compost metagenome]